MPIYVYQSHSGTGCEQCRDGFEILQKLTEPPLAHCPRCHTPLRKLLSAANLGQSDNSLTEKNISKQGFTQYRKLEKGVYEKTAGRGPDLIKDK